MLLSPLLLRLLRLHPPLRAFPISLPLAMAAGLSPRCRFLALLRPQFTLWRSAHLATAPADSLSSAQGRRLSSPAPTLRIPRYTLKCPHRSATVPFYLCSSSVLLPRSSLVRPPPVARSPPVKINPMDDLTMYSACSGDDRLHTPR